MKNTFLNILKKLAIPILGLGLLFLLFQKMDWLPNPAQWFKNQPVTIEETQLLVTEIKQIAELQTAKLYAEVVVDSFQVSQSGMAFKAFKDAILGPFLRYPGLPPGDKLVMVVSGTVIAGIDLQRLTDQSVRIVKDSVWLTLPSSQLLDVITNPSGFDIFIEEGPWGQQAVLAVKQKARQRMITEATQRGLMGKANQQAAQMMRSFLEAAGFKKITIQFEA